MARMSTARTTIDFDRSGKQIGFVDIPHSPHDDAWGATRIPIAVIKNGDGPTVILQAGNHGDEYEGPITLGELIRELDPGMVSGRIIFLPAINVPAVLAGRRTSPVDGLNLNRTFPGDPTGTITQQISAYVSDIVMPLGHAYVDLHSGGSSLNILPSAIIEPAPDAAHRKRNMEAVLAFDAPLSVVIDNLGQPRTSTATSVRAGLTPVGTGMAGAGTQRGYVHGQSDATASAPLENAVHPTEVLATIYHSLGINPETIVYNHLNQPRELVKGSVVTGIRA